ncbi:MFS general substrate transporter [Trichoderma sp. SZMC 28013]
MEASLAPTSVSNGRLDAWLQVLGSWAVLSLSWGLVNSFGVFQTFYEQQLLQSYSPSAISWIGSLQGALLNWVGFISGPLFDAGYLRVQLMTGSFLIVFAQFMTSISTKYYQILLAQGICAGIGMGIIVLPATAVLAQYFQKRRALAIGLSSTGSPLGGIIFSIIFSKLQPIIGFGWATRVIGFILLGLSAIPIAFMHYHTQPVGVRPLIDKTAVRDLPFIFMTFGAFFAFLTLYIAFFYLELFYQQLNNPGLEFGPYIVTMLNIGSIFGRIVPNFLADKFGSLNVITLCCLASAIVLFGWFGLHNLVGVIFFALLYGLFSGSLVSLLPSCIITLSPDIKYIGTRMGMSFSFAGISLLIGTPIAGAILGNGLHFRWVGLIAYSATGLMIGFCCFGASRIFFWKQNGVAKA